MHSVDHTLYIHEHAKDGEKHPNCPACERGVPQKPVVDIDSLRQRLVRLAERHPDQEIQVRIIDPKGCDYEVAAKPEVIVRKLNRVERRRRARLRKKGE